MLQSDDAAERLAAVRLIGAGNEPADAGLLAQAMLDEEAVVRFGAVLAAWRRKDQQCLEALAGRLGDDDAQVRCVAASALAALGSSLVADRLATLLKDDNTAVRLYTAVALTRMNDARGDGELTQLGHVRDGRLQHAVLAALAALDTPQTTAIILGMADSGYFSIQAEVSRLVYERACAGSLEPILKGLEHPNERVRELAIGALNCGPSTERVTQALIRVLQEDPASQNRDAAARALGKTRDPSAVEPIVRAVQNKRVWESGAIEALSQFGEAAIPHLLEMLKGRESDDVVPRAAAHALGQIGHPSAVPGLIEALGHPDQIVRRTSAQSLVVITGQDFGEDQNKWQAWYREQHDGQSDR